MNFKNSFFVACVVIVLAAASAGCRGDEGRSNEPEPEMPVYEPVTLSFYSGFEQTMSESQFVKYVQEPVGRAYPHITLTYSVTGAGNTIQELIVTGNVPDLIVNGPASLSLYQQLELTFDSTPFIREIQFDLERLEPTAVEFIQRFSPPGQLYSMPYMNANQALVYNIDLFERFGVDHPEDFMTYDQIYGIARAMSRMENEVQYRGLDFFLGPLMHYNQRGLSYVNPVTHRSEFNSEGWRTVLENLRRFYAVPGNEFKTNNFNLVLQDFVGHRILAMVISPFQNVFNGIIVDEEIINTFNWDLVTLPTYTDRPNVGAGPAPNHIMVSGISNHKRDAFLVVETLLSDEVQTLLSQDGHIPVLREQRIKDVFMTSVDFAKEKNVGSLFLLDRAAPRQVTEFDSLVSGLLANRAVSDVSSGRKDVNTALREAEETANRNIEAEKAK